MKCPGGYIIVLIGCHSVYTQYMIDYSRFHSTVAVDMPPYSAKQLIELATTGRRGSTSSSISSGTVDDDADGDDGVATPSVRSGPVTKPVRVASVSGVPAAAERRRTIPCLTRANGISSAALAAFDIQPDDEQSFQTMIDCNRVALTTNADGDSGAYGFF